MITQNEILVTFSFIAGSALGFMGPWIIRRSKRTAIPKEKSGKILCCSFCGKNQTEVTKLIAGPEVYICDECIDLCSDVLRTDQKHDLLFSRTDAEAMELFRELAEKGDFKAQIHLGRLYRNGENIPRDDSEALKWYRMAAEQGDAFAQGMVGQLYHEKESAEANKWFRKSSLNYMNYERKGLLTKMSKL